MTGLVVMARLVLVVVFVTAGVAKAVDLASTRRSLREFGVPAPLVAVAAVALVAVELLTAALLCWAETAWAGGVLALVLLLVFCAVAGANLAKGRAPACNCFGQVHSEPVGPQLLVRNVLFAATALVVVVGGSSDPGPSAWSWASELTSAEVVLVAALVVLAAVVVALALRVRRLASRVEVLSVAQAEMVSSLARSVAGSGSEGGVEDVPPAALEPEPPAPAALVFDPGLPVGSVAPGFSLATSAGEVSLADLLALDKRIVLLFVAPTCGTCHDLLPKPVGWAASYGDVLSFALITAGSVEANEGIEVISGGFEPVLYDPGPARSAYEVAATPGGVVVGRDGRIETETVYGVAEIAMLVMRTAAAERARLGPVA